MTGFVFTLASYRALLAASSFKAVSKQRRLEVVRQTGCAMGVAFHLCRMALMIAYRLVQFWTGYFKQIEDAGGFDFERAAASAATRRLKRRRILFPPKRN